MEGWDVTDRQMEGWDVTEMEGWDVTERWKEEM